MNEGGYSDDAQIQGNVTPLLVAAGIGREDAFTDEEKKAALEAVKLLVSLGADVNAHSATGWTPLHAAAYAGADAIVQFLIEHGAVIDVQNGCGQTPLSLAEGKDAKGLLKRTKTRTSTLALLKKLGAGKSRPRGPLGKCVEGRWGI
jgi:ankyrin repeat protein